MTRARRMRAPVPMCMYIYIPLYAVLYTRLPGARAAAVNEISPREMQRVTRLLESRALLARTAGVGRAGAPTCFIKKFRREARKVFMAPSGKPILFRVVFNNGLVYLITGFVFMLPH